MTSRCDASSSTRGNQSSTPGLWLEGGPCPIGSGWDERKATGSRLLPGLQLGAQVLFWQGVGARLLPPPSLIFNKNMPHRPPHPQLKEQEAGSPGTRILSSPAWHAPHSFRRNSTPKTGLFIPLQCGEPQRERCRIIWDSSTHTVTLHQGRHFSKEWV